MTMPYIHKTPGWLKSIYPSLIWDFSDRSEKAIYLTFDDGPIPEVTEFVLDQLDQFDAKATFFCVGENIVKHPAVLERIRDEGHSIGNHTHNHIKGWNTTNTIYYENIARCAEVITEAGGSDRRLFRPPYGRIGYRQIKSLRAEYDIIMWDVLTGDYNASLSPSAILTKIKSATMPGSIVLFHDSIKAFPRMREVLPEYLTYFRDKGFRFLAI